MKTIVIKLTNNEGRWFGRIIGVRDAHGNDIDCFLSTRQDAVNSLLYQLREYEKTEERERIMSDEILKVCEVREAGDEQNTAWCECGDALETIPIKNESGMIINHEYFCFGCQKTYILTSR